MCFPHLLVSQCLNFRPCQAKREQLLNEIRGLVAAEGCVNLVHWYAGLAQEKPVDPRPHSLLV